MFEKLELTRMAQSLAAQSGARMAVIAENVANADTPGYKAKDVLGKDPKFLQGPATDPATIRQLVKDLNAAKTFEGRTINYRADGSPFIMHWRVLPVKSGRGASAKVENYVAIQRVISA